jgi:hypothetical protein
VKRKIETKPEKAGFTWLGPAKPDDPVFKEGWTVSIAPQSKQKPPKPSGSTPDDNDELESAKRDKEQP